MDYTVNWAMMKTIFFCVLDFVFLFLPSPPGYACRLSHTHIRTHTHAAWIQTPLPRLGSLSSVSSAPGSSPPYPYMPGSPQPWASGRKEKRGWELWRLLVWLSPKFIAFQQQSGLFFFFCIQSRNGFPQCVYVRNPSLYISLLCSAESVGFETDVWCVVVFKHTCSKSQSTVAFMLRPSLRWELEDN
jgi:hypothetical protein